MQLAIPLYPVTGTCVVNSPEQRTTNREVTFLVQRTSERQFSVKPQSQSVISKCLRHTRRTDDKHSPYLPKYA